MEEICIRVKNKEKNKKQCKMWKKRENGGVVFKVYFLWRIWNT